MATKWKMNNAETAIHGHPTEQLPASVLTLSVDLNVLQTANQV